MDKLILDVLNGGSRMMLSSPDPVMTDDLRPFFEAAAKHQFVLMHCRKCGAWYWPYTGCRHHDNDAFLENMEWEAASGRGKIFTFTVAHVSFNSAFPAPSIYAIVELDEGPLMPTNIIGCRPDDVYVGLPVIVEFMKNSNGLVLPKFKPA